MAVMTAAELIAKLKGAQAQPTYYVMGCFGAYISDKNIKRYTTNNDYNRKNAAAIKKNAMGKFGFDCVCLIKGILWGWNANKSATYGGATYTSNGVPDIGADSMIKVCKDVSTDFSKIIPGEAVWLSGHIGVYIGDGLVIECTPKWENKVQITACENIGKVAGYNSRRWTKHGKLPYVDYSAVQAQAPVQNTTPVQDNEKTIWDYLVKLTGNTYGAAGLMGNLYAESGLKPGNLQNSYEKSLGMNDAQYVAAVDSGAYTNFVKDSAGFGLAQWTYWSRKQNLLQFAKARKASIADLNMQLDFLTQELRGYPGVMRALQGANNVREASDAVLTGFERPKDQSESAKAKRASYGQAYYDKYAKANTQPVSSGKEVKASHAAQKMDKSLAGTYKTTADLHLRNGAGTSEKSLVIIPKGTQVKCYGYYSLDNTGVKWLYIQLAMNGITYVGFSSSKYLKK